LVLQVASVLDQVFKGVRERVKVSVIARCHLEFGDRLASFENLVNHGWPGSFDWSAALAKAIATRSTLTTAAVRFDNAASII
jgi:hypothetical protein